VVLVKFLEDTSEEEWDRVAEVNLKFIFPAVQYAVASMMKQGQGCIISTASAGGFPGQYMTPAYLKTAESTNRRGLREPSLQGGLDQP
jgi:NAD(P)-dependent dehydrogenase (short-subunit alcohol dehydrogenase family)